MRVIQDSDDEFEDDAQDEVQGPQTRDARVDLHNHGNDASLPSGTGSTDSQKRAFAQAHRDHLQSTSTLYNLPSQEEPPSSVSLPEHVSKKMKTLHDESARIFSPIASSETGPITHSEEQKSTESSPFLHLINDRTNAENSVPMYDTLPLLESSAHEGYMQHNPMALFPEPSSTIPNATLTQQRVLEGVAAPALLGMECEADLLPHQPAPEGSVPWSEILKFSSTGIAEQSELSDPRTANDADTALVQESWKKSQETSRSQQNRRGSGSLARRRGSPSRTDVTLGAVDSKHVMPSPQLTLQSQEFGFASTASQNLQSDPQGKRSKSSPQQKHNDDSSPQSQKDLAAIGLPMEQYRPRPSRSRSLKVTTDEPIDFSVRPERAAQGAKRRRTTTAVTTGTCTPEFIATPEKVKQICDMGFTPTSTSRALKQNNGDVTVTVEWLITNCLGEDELASSNTSKGRPVSKKLKSDRSAAAEGPQNLKVAPIPDIVHSPELSVGIETPQKPTLVQETGAIVGNMDDTVTNQQKSPKVQVIIAAKSPKPKTSDPDNICPPEVTAEKKRGRGRPKKIPNAGSSTEPIKSITEEIQPVLGDEADLDNQTIEPNPTTLTASITSNKSAFEDIKVQNSTSIATTKDTAFANSTSERSVKLSDPSPLSKGKTIYRVGLSKRARIAPLLRTVRK